MKNSRNQITPENSARQLIDNQTYNTNNMHKKSSFQNNIYQISSKDCSYYPVNMNIDNEQQDKTQPQIKSETNKQQNANPNSNQRIPEGSQENLHQSVLSPDFLENRKKFKSQKQEQTKKKKDYYDEQENPNKQKTFQLFKVQNEYQSELDQINQTNSNFSQQLNQNDYKQSQQINKQKHFLTINPCLNTQNSSNSPTSVDYSQSPKYQQVNMPISSQFYFMFFQILPEGILLLGQKQNKVHIQNRNLERMMNCKGSMSVEKFLSLENTLSNVDQNETLGNSDFMPQILNMKNIIYETVSQQKVNSASNFNSNMSHNPLNQQFVNTSTQISQQNNLLPQPIQLKYQTSVEDKKFLTIQNSSNNLPSMPNISIISPENPNQTQPQQQEELQIQQQYQQQQINQQLNISSYSQQQQIFSNLLNNQHSQNVQQQSQLYQQQQLIDESIIQKSTLRFTPTQPIQTNLQNGQHRNSLLPKKDSISSPIQYRESLAEDQIMKQISNLKTQFTYESQVREHSYSISGGNQQLSNQTFSNIEVTVSRKKTIGDLYKSLIMEIKQEIDNNASVTKYEAFESQVKMICSLPNVRKRNVSNPNMKSQLYLSQLQISQNQTSKCDSSENVESSKKYYEVTCIPCVIEGSPSVLFVVRDVTHFNQIQLLKHVNKNKSKMLTQVAHEFRTPLNCIISMMEIATVSNPSQIITYFSRNF